MSRSATWTDWRTKEKKAPLPDLSSSAVAPHGYIGGGRRSGVGAFTGRNYRSTSWLQLDCCGGKLWALGRS